MTRARREREIEYTRISPRCAISSQPSPARSRAIGAEINASRKLTPPTPISIHPAVHHPVHIGESPRLRATANPNYKRPLILIGGSKSGQRSHENYAICLSPSPLPPCLPSHSPRRLNRSRAASARLLIYVYTLIILIYIKIESGGGAPGRARSDSVRANPIYNAVRSLSTIVFSVKASANVNAKRLISYT